MNTLAHLTAELLNAGYQALGAISTPEVTTHYYVHPTECRLAFVSAGRTHTKVRTYFSSPLEVLALATLCREQQTANRAEAVRTATAQLAVWGLHFDHSAHATKRGHTV